MADNVAVQAATGGTTTTVATDTIGGIAYQRVKPAFGEDGAATDASSANPFPVYLGSALPAGSAAIGKLAANSGVDIGDVDVTTAPAAARSTDSIAAALATDAVMSNLTALTPKFANIAIAASSNSTLVSAVSGKTIRVVSLFLVAASAVNVYFVDSAGSPTALAGNSTNKINLSANGGFVLPFNPVGWFQTSATNLNLNINCSAAVTIGGSLGYLEV